MKRKICFLIFIILLIKLSLFATSYIAIYDSLVFENNIIEFNLMHNNFNGVVVWGTSKLMSSLLTMYEKTNDEKYIKNFIVLAENIISKENKKKNLIDSDGKKRRGWQTGSRYLFSKPTIFYDNNKNPSLKITAIGYGHNDKVYITITNNEKNFDLTVLNKDTNKTKTFKGLTQNSIEDIINTNLSPSSIIKVKKLGDSLPQKVVEYKLPSNKITLTTFHNPRILTPLTRFCYIIKKYNLIKYKRYVSKFIPFVKEVEESYQNLWIDNDTTGYYIIEKDIPTFYAGLEVPNNILSDHGRLYLYMFLFTQDSIYKNKLKKIYNHIKNEFYYNNGKVLFNYTYGSYYNGWKNSKVYNYEDYEGFKRVEDNSHFCSTIDFIIDCYENNLFFDELDINNLKKILRQSLKDNYMSYSINGNGDDRYSYAGGYYIRIPDISDEYIRKIIDIYEKRYTNTQFCFIINGWANIIKVINDK